MDNLYLRFDEEITEKLIKCKQCGKCCDGIFFTHTGLTEEDLSRIERFLGKKIDIERIAEANIIRMKQPCEFHINGSCSIYHVRPLTCRQYPLYLGEGTIKADSLNCVAAKEYQEKHKQKYALQITKSTTNFEVVDTKMKGEDVDWSKFFLFNGKIYNYYVAAYNNTSINEREIEIPIIVDYIRNYPPESMLEIGNVLSHYFKNVSHTIVDKYEKADRVINEDITAYSPNKKFDLIISISTMEHVGFDGDGVFKLTKDQVAKGFENVASILSPHGKFVFTIPLYFHPELDHLLKTDQLVFDEVYCMERSMIDNTWSQVEFKDIKEKSWNNFVQNVTDSEGNIYALRRIRYLLIGVIYGKGG